MAQDQKDSREDRAKVIASKPNGVKEVEDGLFTVLSQSGTNQYWVANRKGWTCNCLDHTTRGIDCKHILATRYYLEAQHRTKNGIVSERMPLTHTQAWSAYNAAQTEEISLFDSLLGDLVEQIEEPEQVMGRPRLPIKEQLFCAIQKVYSQLSSRRAQTLFRNATERGQIEHAPHFNAPSKLFNRPDVTPILHQLIMQSAQPIAGVEVDFAIDSTGFRTTSFSLYNGMKHGGTKEHKWLKAHMCVGVKTNIVTSVIITDGEGADSPQFIPLIEKTAEGFKVREVSADMAYSARKNIDTVKDLGGSPYIPFKSNATGRALGSPAWKKMYHYFQLNHEEFMQHYHKRSNVESTNAAIKRKFGETLKSKNRVAQANELLAKIVAYNITVIIHEMHENGIEPDFLNLRSKENHQIVKGTA